MSNKKIYIGAGHGGNGSTPGKRSPAGEYEWDFNNVIVKSLQKHLEHNGFKVYRGDDATGRTDVSLASRAAIANKNNVDLYLSIHNNANTSKWGNWTGTETFYCIGSKNGQKIASLVQKHALKVLGLRDRGIKSTSTLYECKVPKAPSVIFEGGFMDSTIDIKVLRNKTKLEECGKAICKAVCEYFNQSFKDLDGKTSNTTQKTTTNQSKEVIHVVRKGDTVSQLAKTYKTTMKSIKELNKLDSKYTIKIGEKIIVKK